MALQQSAAAFVAALTSFKESPNGLDELSMPETHGNVKGKSSAPQEPFWTRQRRELAQWFEDRAPSFVEGYVGAVRLLHMPTFHARVHFVCHAIRDIYRYLPTSLGAKLIPRPSEVFPNMVKDLATRWQKHPPQLAHEPGSDYSVSPQVYRYVERIVRKSVDMTNQHITVGQHLANALFHSLDRREDEFIAPWIIKSFNDEYDFFVSRAHLAQSVEKIPGADGLIENFEAFERAFHSLVGPYFSGKEELDAILQVTNEEPD